MGKIKKNIFYFLIAISLLQDSTNLEYVNQKNNNYNKFLNYFKIKSNNIRVIDYEFKLNEEKDEEINKKIKEFYQSGEKNLDEIINFSLDITSNSLSFRFYDFFIRRNKGKNYFNYPVNSIKKTDCWDYSYLFAAVFNKTIESSNLKNKKAEVVRGNFQLFSLEHDWVRIKKGDSILKNVDPTFYDYNIPHNLDYLIKD